MNAGKYNNGNDRERQRRQRKQKRDRTRAWRHEAATLILNTFSGSRDHI